MPPKVAIIDMGTNTFHLLIADMESKPRILIRERRAVKIGKGGINANKITPEGQQRAIHALKEFKETLEKYQVTKTLAFGTSAIRDASNGRELVNEIKQITGIETRIINGDEEAELIYFGIVAAMDLGIQKSLIVDIGGGSVEFIIGNREQIFWKRSFEIGAQRLLEKFQKHDPILQEEINELMDFFAKQLQPLLEQMIKYQPTILVGSSGTFDTLSEIHCIKERMPIHPEDTETPLTFESFNESYREIISKDRSGRLAIPGMIEMRVDMIVVACCLVKFLIDTCPFEKVRVSTYSLKEGVLFGIQDSKFKI